MIKKVTVLLTFTALILSSCNSKNNSYVGVWQCNIDSKYNIKIVNIGNNSLSIELDSGRVKNGSVDDSGVLRTDDGWTLRINENSGELIIPDMWGGCRKGKMMKQ